MHTRRHKFLHFLSLVSQYHKMKFGECCSTHHEHELYQYKAIVNNAAAFVAHPVILPLLFPLQPTFQREKKVLKHVDDGMMRQEPYERLTWEVV